MSDFLQMDIFFFLASLGTVIFIIFMVLILVQIFFLTKALRRIIERIDTESQKISEDITSMRNFVVEKKRWLTPLTMLWGLRNVINSKLKETSDLEGDESVKPKRRATRRSRKTITIEAD